MASLLQLVIGGIEGFEVTGLAANGPEARLMYTRHRPELVLLDEVLPGESSLDLLADLASLGIPVILVTSMEDPAHPVPPLALGRIIKPGWDRLEADRSRVESELRKLASRISPAFTR